MLRRVFLLGACLILPVVSGLAAAKPDFSGTWKVNGDKSDFGPIPKPEKYESKVDHKDPELKVSTTQSMEQGERTFEAAFSTDGKETINKFGPTEMKSTAKWAGELLVIDSQMDFQGNEVTSHETWKLSEDGKVVTIDRTIGSPQGELQMKIVLDKQ